MAKSIRYQVSETYNFVPINWNEPDPFWTYEEPPENLDYVRVIYIDRLGTHEADFIADDYEDDPLQNECWKRLAPGQDFPEGMMKQTAIVFVEAIWLDTIMHNVTGHTKVINQFFLDTLIEEVCFAVEGHKYPESYEEVRYNGMHLNFELFRQIAEEGGVDHRIDAWLSGVPLEYVLAE